MSDMTPATVNVNGVDASVVEKNTQLIVLFAEGKRAYIIGNLAVAVDKFSEASEFAVESFGEFAAEAVEPLYYYGKTMLEMASVEDRVFTNAMQNTNEDENDEDQEDQTPNEQIGNPEELTETEQEEIADTVADALEENAAELDQAQNPTDATECQDTEGGEAATEEVKPVEGSEKAEGKNGKTEESNEKTEESDGKTEESDEKPIDEDTNNDESAILEETAGDGEGSQDDEPELVQLAWEALELARAICDKHLEVEGFKQKKADVLLELIECSIQNCNYKQAMDDVEGCIEVCKGIDDLKDRRLDGAYFNKARAYALDKQYDKAALTYTQVKQHIERRLAMMEKELTEETDAGKKDELRKEVLSLKELIDHIQVKVDDALESAKSAAQMEKAQSENTSKMGELKATVPGEASDITGLVRKKAVKRPAVENDTKTTIEKKPKEEETHEEQAAVAQ